MFNTKKSYCSVMVRLTERILPAIYARNGIADVGRKWLVERTDRLHRDWVVETENEAGKRVCCLYNPGWTKGSVGICKREISIPQLSPRPFDLPYAEPTAVNDQCVKR